MTAIKTALVGFGISGQSFQAPIIEALKEFELTSVVSSNPAKVKGQLPDAAVYASLEELLEKGDEELVVIATPNELHGPFAEKALRAGKHVVVEKPFTIESAEGERIAALAQELGQKLSIYHSRRFDGDYLTIKRLMNEGQLGTVHTLFSSYNRFRPEVKVRWREQDIPGAGILYDLGSHLIDQAVSLFGVPQAVTAKLRKQRPGAQAVDHFHICLAYEACDVIVHGNNLSTAEGPRFQVFGTKGAFIKYGMDTQEDLLRELKGPGSNGWGEDPQARWGEFTDSEGKTVSVPTERGGYEQFYLEMAAAIRSDAPVPVKPRQAIATIKIIEAAYESSASNRTVFL
ncbi:oxidoreductase [Pseudovibrio sp. SPO723]|uniref:oxidoreductase n=1 Tax=Nesiotobacter zosterae TaxID=392721 RepID=UPI0029C3D4E6|nr:oxidoreductase [Pseudovibrio sp. SPO723]MDX5592187.1 oxidoreductase [Pseudovibrio sp. SPO723]